MGGLLSKIFLVDLFQGLWVTFRNQNPKHIYTWIMRTNSVPSAGPARLMLALFR